MESDGTCCLSQRRGAKISKPSKQTKTTRRKKRLQVFLKRPDGRRHLPQQAAPSEGMRGGSKLRRLSSPHQGLERGEKGNGILTRAWKAHCWKV